MRLVKVDNLIFTPLLVAALLMLTGFPFLMERGCFNLYKK